MDIGRDRENTFAGTDDLAGADSFALDQRAKVMDRQVDRRGRGSRFQPRANGKCHCRIDQRSRHAAVQNAAWLTQVVPHVDGNDGFIQFEIDETHPDQLRKRQTVQSVRRKLSVCVGDLCYFGYILKIVHLIIYSLPQNRKIATMREFRVRRNLTKTFEALNLIITEFVQRNGDNLRRWQRRYTIGAALVAPISPFLYLQGQYTRWKVGVLPDAAGPTTGRTGEGDAAKLFVLGESTVAGLGARTHELALAGQFAKNLSAKIGRPVEWRVVGKSGVTARQTIDELLPRMPDTRFDYILVGLGGNDVLKLSPPRRWRRDMTELLGRLRGQSPDAVIFLSNCPMICLSPALPNPLRSVLWQLSKLHNDNISELTSGMERVFYYPQPADVTLEGFFADGIHPSERGYADWSQAMMKYFSEHHEW